MMPVTAKNEFNQSAERQDPAVFDYEREVAQAWRDFPGIKDEIFFIDVGADGKLVYPGAPMRQQALQNTFKGYVQGCIQKEGKTSFCDGDGPYEAWLLFLLTEKHSRDLLDKAAPVAQETAFVFDHELGHLVVPEDLEDDDDDVYKTEDTPDAYADAYAVIRHFQRYGADSPTIEAIVANRAFDLVFKDADYGRAHFTSPVTEKILARRYDTDWDSLTPAQTVQKARDFVRESKMDAAALNTLSDDFGALHNKAKAIKNGDAAPLQALAEKVLSTASSSVVKYGVAALELCIEQQASAGLFTGQYWDNVRKELAKKKQELAQPKIQPATAYKTAMKVR